MRAGHAVCGSDHIMRDRDRRLCGVGPHDATLDDIRCTGDAVEEGGFWAIQYAMPDHTICDAGPCIMPPNPSRSPPKAYSNEKKRRFEETREVELEVEEWEEAMADDLEARSRWWPARDKFGDG